MLRLAFIALGARAFNRGSARRTGRPNTARSATFHAEGDLSGQYQLSGVWKLSREPDQEPPAVPIQNNVLCWSGDRWRSLTRPLVRAATLVTLDPAGGFESPAGAKEAIRGKWSMADDEVTLARFGRHGNHVVETWIGAYNSSKNRVKGTMLAGASEPEYAGKFRMTPAFPGLQPVVENEKAAASGPVFFTKDVVGEYTLEFRGSDSISAYDVALYSNRTWETTSPMAGGARLAGTWNVFDDSVDLASGIAGEGGRLWIWLRRFGAARSSGVHLTHDRLYLGRISPVSGGGDGDERPRVRRVAGQVAIGWSTEPAFIGSFRLRPKFE